MRVANLTKKNFEGFALCRKDDLNARVFSGVSQAQVTPVDERTNRLDGRVGGGALASISATLSLGTEGILH